QIIVGHRLKTLHVVAHHGLERAFGADVLVDLFIDARRERAVLDHHAQRFEDRSADFGHELAHAHARFLDFAHGVGERVLETRALFGDAAACGDLDVGKIGGRLEAMRTADADARRRTEAGAQDRVGVVGLALAPGLCRLERLEALDRLLHLAPVTLSLLLLALKPFGKVRVDHERADLPGNGARKAYVFGNEAAPAAALDDEHTSGAAAFSDRHAEKRMIFFFAGLGEEFETRM